MTSSIFATHCSNLVTQRAINRTFKYLKVGLVRTNAILIAPTWSYTYQKH